MPCIDEDALRAANRKELRQWLTVSRLYESDLLLNPASAVRAQLSAPDVPTDPFAEFACKDGQLLRTEEQEREDEDDGTVLQARHTP